MISRKSRFRDEKGNPVTPEGLIYAPRALLGGVMRKLFGYRPALPWISFRAIKSLNQLIQRDWKMAEFGSGMSTTWLAKRCGYLYSVESDPEWHQAVSELLKEKKIHNVQYELKKADHYADVSAFPDRHFDFALVDGIRRSECLDKVLPKMKKQGWIYLDNSDTDLDSENGDMRIAERQLVSEAKKAGGTLTYFVDFAPTQFFVNQGILAQL